MAVTVDPIYALTYSPPGTRYDFAWNQSGGVPGVPMVLTFGFVSQAWPDGGYPLPPPAQTAIREAFARWAAVSGLSFVEVSDNGPGGDAMIRIEVNPAAGGAADGGVPYPNATSLKIRFTPATTEWSTSPDAYRYIALHEVGHTLGLKHPHDGDWNLPAELDHRGQTVMSYRNAPGSNGAVPSELGALDLAAIQYLYGTEAQEASDQIAWSLDPAARRFTFTGGGAGDRLIGTFLADHIYGGGGDDVLSGLRGDDLLVGGPGADRYRGGDGDDTIMAGADGDTLVDAGAGRDWIDYSLAAAPIRLAGSTVTAATGTDRLEGAFSLEAIRGSPFGDQLDLRGGAMRQADGGAGADTISVTSGPDTVDGGDGADVVTIGHLRLSSLGRFPLTRYDDTVWLHEPSLTRSPDVFVRVETFAFLDREVSASTLPQFRPLTYIASHADLRAAFGGDWAAGLDHWVRWGFSEARDPSAFRPFTYIASYADLTGAYGPDAEAGAGHYIRFGAAEGRGLLFPAWQYLASHGDLRAAFGADPEAAAAHWLGFGRAEGRGVTFDGVRYIASYDDLIRALGPSGEVGAAHLLRNGVREGRTTTFDPLDYIASHGDLLLAFGTDAAAGARHFVQYGFFESRVRDSFDAAAYLARYADLKAAFGSDLTAATRHFIEHGFREGRTDDWS